MYCGIANSQHRYVLSQEHGKNIIELRYYLLIHHFRVFGLEVDWL